MKRILFVCHGNICRSPMAEFVLKDMAQRAGIAEQFEIASAATSFEDLGNPVCPPAVRSLFLVDYRTANNLFIKRRMDHVPNRGRKREV